MMTVKGGESSKGLCCYCRIESSVYDSRIQFVSVFTRKPEVVVAVVVDSDCSCSNNAWYDRVFVEFHHHHHHHHSDHMVSSHDADDDADAYTGESDANHDRHDQFDHYHH